MIWAKIIGGAMAILITALIALLGQQLLVGYGEARYAAGRADANVARSRAIAAASAAATKAALAAGSRMAAASHTQASELARLLPLILKANDKVNAYAQTDAGRTPCLDADRVRGIEQDRITLFAHPAATGYDDAGSVPSDPTSDTLGSQPDKR